MRWAGTSSASARLHISHTRFSVMSSSNTTQIVFVDQQQAKLLPADGIEQKKEHLGDYDILVQAEHSLISPGTELSWFSGIQRDVSGDAFTYPVYTGYCHSGKVLAHGKEVREIREGDRIVSGAGHVSHAVIDTRKEFEVDHSDLKKPVALVPERIPSELAPFAKIGEIAFTAVRVADFSLGEKVLVLGQGMVGNLAAQLFQIAGADVLAADISEFRLQKAGECGVKRRVNPEKLSLQEEIEEWTGGYGVDVTVESTGNSKLLLDAVHYTRRLGEIIVLGTPRRAMEFNPTPELWHAHMKGISIKGALRCLFYPLHSSKLNRRSVERDLWETLALMESEELRVAPLHTHSYKPDECQRAYSELLDARDRAIGAVFDWTEGKGAGNG